MSGLFLSFGAGPNPARGLFRDDWFLIFSTLGKVVVGLTIEQAAMATGVAADCHDNAVLRRVDDVVRSKVRSAFDVGVFIVEPKQASN